MPHQPSLIEPLEPRSLLSAAPATTGSVRGGLFFDQNLNGVNDAGDIVLDQFAGVYLDTNNNGGTDSGDIHAVMTDGGHYHINNLAPGVYRLRVSFTMGYTLENTDGYNIHIFAGKTVRRWIPVTPPASVSGTFFIDTNGDGVQDDGEQPLDITSEAKLPGLYIAADITGAPPVYQHRPIGGGVYHIVSIPPGTYHLHVIRAAYHYTTPIDVVLTFKAGQTITRNFGLRLPLP